MQLLPKSTASVFGWFIVYSSVPHIQGTSSWLWRFNSLFLRLLGEISLSLLCSHCSWGSALDLAPPLHVSHLRVSVPHSDRTGLKERLIRGALAHSGQGEGGVWNAGLACGNRGQCDVPTAWGMLCILPGKLSLDHGTLAVMGCTGSWEGRWG